MNWKILNKKTPTEINDVLSLLLVNRELNTKEEQEAFLNPLAPDKMTAEDLGIGSKQLKKALERIKKAVEKKEQIVVFGDYDCDGICSTAIMWSALFSLGAKVLPFIPDRMEEGYGLSKKALDHLKRKIPDASLIITVDHGIVAVEPTKYARSLGFEVIISDHHTLGKKLPQATAIVHTTKLAGSGVAWFLAQQIKKSFAKKEVEDLDLAAFGTIADLVPLVGPNRSIVKFGLQAFNQTQKVGIQSLVKECGLMMGKLGTYEISYVLAPRINALGRIDNALDALRLLCTKNPTKAEDLSKRLCEINGQRQKLTEETVLHAKDLLTISQKTETKLLFVAHDMYNQGVIGLVAGKLVEEYYRPAVVVSKGETLSKASARSISGFNIIEAIRSKSEFLLEAGGHPMAAGFTVETKNLVRLEEELLKTAEELISDEMLVRLLKIDCQLDLNLANMTLWEELQKLLPCGMANPEPVFASRVEVVETRVVGNKGQHLQIKVKPENTTGPLSPIFPSIAFNQSYLAGKIKTGDIVEIAYSIAKDEWNGGNRLQLKIKDLKNKVEEKSII